MQKGASSQLDLQHILQEIVPTKKRKLAHSILKALLRDKTFSWNEHGEIMVNHKTYKKSNILDLVKHVLSQSGKKKVRGMTAFYNVLMEKDLPHSLLDRIRRRSNRANWRPPGTLVA